MCSEMDYPCDKCDKVVSTSELRWNGWNLLCEECFDKATKSG